MGIRRQLSDSLARGNASEYGTEVFDDNYSISVYCESGPVVLSTVISLPHEYLKHQRWIISPAINFQSLRSKPHCNFMKLVRNFSINWACVI